MRLSSSRSTAILHRPQQDFLLWDKAGTRPSLDQQFADREDLIDAISGQQLITFTRASSGTYVGSDGLIKTAVTNEARFDHDPVTGESLGLLVEEQRSNLLLNSGTLATQDVTVTAVAHTLSFYGSGTVTLSGTHTATVVGTGAYPARTTLTFTPTAGTLTVTVSGTVEYANLEIGSFASSYIPTTGSTVTRAADVASISGSNFSSWYRQDEGTVFMGFRTIAEALGIFSASDGGFGNRHQAYMSDGSVIVRTSALGVASNNGLGSALLNQNNKAAFGFSSGTTSGSLNGNINTTTQAIPNNLDVAYFGASANGTVGNPVVLQRITYWPTRLGDETLQTITQ